MKNDSMGDRFKRYERTTDLFLTRRTPVIARIDGKAFHELTKHCVKPFDNGFALSMLAAAKALCEEIQGCKMAYWQSDEISLLICDYDNIDTQAWFDYRLQKMCSIAASIASMKFSSHFDRFGIFDARFFNVPENDVINYFVWRQKDAERNSLQMAAQALYSQKELHGKKKADLHEMLHEKGVNWDNLPIWQKRGLATIKQKGKWDSDGDTPIFAKNRGYIESKFILAELEDCPF